jgi:hypothetical protein
MREVYANPAEARTVGKRAATRAVNFTWRKSGRKIVEALRKHGMLPAMANPAREGRG